MTLRRILGFGMLGVMLAAPLVSSAEPGTEQKKGGKRKGGSKKGGKKGPMRKKGGGAE